MSRPANSGSNDVRKVRATISFRADHYAELERIAENKKVSLAWVVREAVERYLAEQWPLLDGLEAGGQEQR